MFVELSKYEALARGISESTWKLMKAYEKQKYVEAHPTSRYAELYNNGNESLPTTINNPVKAEGEQYSTKELLDLAVLDDSVFDKLWENIEFNSAEDKQKFEDNKNSYNKRLMNIVNKLSASPDFNKDSNMIEFNHTNKGCELYLTDKNNPLESSYKIEFPTDYYEKKRLGSEARLSKFNAETLDWDLIVNSINGGITDIYDHFLGNERQLRLKCKECGSNFKFKYNKGELKAEPNDQGVFSIDLEPTGKNGRLLPNGKCLCIKCHSNKSLNDKVSNLINTEKKAQPESIIQRGRAELSKIVSKLKGLNLLGKSFTYDINDRKDYVTLGVWDDDDDCVGGFNLSFTKDGIYYDGVSFNDENIDEDDYENIKIDNIDELLESQNFKDMLQDLQNAVEDRENARKYNDENEDEEYYVDPDSEDYVEDDDEDDDLIYIEDDDDEITKDNVYDYV